MAAAQKFADEYRSGEQGCEMDADAAQTLARNIDRLLSALEFYADPETYHATVVFADPPCGEFASDLSDVDHPDYENSYGAKARAALT